MIHMPLLSCAYVNCILWQEFVNLIDWSIDGLIDWSIDRLIDRSMMMMMMIMMQMQISSDSASRDIMSHMARNVTVWEFINMKVNRSLQRPNAKIRLVDMLNELEELHRQFRKLARDELCPLSCDTDQPCPASKILVVSWYLLNVTGR